MREPEERERVTGKEKENKILKKKKQHTVDEKPKYFALALSM